MFVSLVHSNERLTNVQRFHYLKGNLRGDALVLVDAYAITDSNYIDAWRTLNETYNNERVLLSNHWQAFSALAPIEGESAPALKSLSRGVARIQQALRSMDREESAWDDWRVFFTVSRLDVASRREWERSLGHTTSPPSFAQLETFIKGRIQMLEAIPPARSKQSIQSRTTSQPRSVRAHHAGTAPFGDPCSNCSASHYIGHCPKLLGLDVQQRRARTAELRLCFNCLRPGHARDACPSSRSCAVCQERHHSCLHLVASGVTAGTVRRPGKAKRPAAPRAGPHSSARAEGSATAAPSAPSGQALALHTTPATPSRVILATAIVVLQSPAGRSVSVRALLDLGAELSFISEACAQSLRLTRRSSDLSLVGIGGSSLGTVKHFVDVVLSSPHDAEFRTPLEACVMTKVTNVTASTGAALADWAHLRSLFPLADPIGKRTSRIDVLLGADICGALLLPDIRQGPPGSPTAQLTKLGWTIFGPNRHAAANDHRPLTAVINHCQEFTTVDVPGLLQRFWEIEELPGVRVLSPNNAACEQHFVTTHRRTSTGRYVVRLPFKTDRLPSWADSLPIAIGCLSRLKKRCLSDPRYGSKYEAFLEEYAALGHMRQVEEVSPRSEITPFYMPHHGVMRGEDAGGGKLRVVFNASQKTRSGTSLNDHLLVGPTLQRDLINVILAWRRHAVVVIADIAKMYRQILVDERDADYQRIVWRKAPSQPILHFSLSTVTYGTACAPFLAIRTLSQLADDEQHRFPHAAEVLRHQCYVDDILTGADDVTSARQLRQDLIDLLRSGGFELRKWASNREELIADLPTEWLQSSATHTFEDDSIKALGLEWSPTHDCFRFRVKLRPDPAAAATKRTMLSAIARLFDPVGWIAPIIVVGKILLQDLWLTGIDWDTPVPEHVADAWRVFSEDLPSLEVITIPRWIGCVNEEGACYELHGFADASTRAYAAAIYLRVRRDSGTTVVLLAAKTKVAPVKQLSIPRLELCGAALLSRLVLLVRSALSMSSVPVTLWSDSQVVLAWLRGHASRWNTFVANRVSAVQSALPEAQWRHVPTKDNPADLASRGVNPAKLAASSLWWSGPSWLVEDSLHWPPGNDSGVTDLEKRATATVLATGVTSSWDLPTRISSATLLWRVTARCLRFVHNCRVRRHDRTLLRLGPLTSAELHAARLVCLKSVQAAAFAEELSALAGGQEVPRRSPLRKLRPFVDPSGILRVGGRLQRSRLNFEGRHPALLPKRSALSSLLIADAHQRVLHGGTLATLHHLLTNYWVLGAKNAVRAHIHRCTRCVRLRAAVATPIMGDLPASRVTPTRPFLRAGVDYAGPIHLRTTKGRGHRSTKGYIALFICLWSKAIHLEVVSDCSTSAFLAAFRRFTSRRGLCRELISDNGTTFHGADAELRRMFNQCSAFQHDIAEIIVNDGTTWSFIPPAAPHFGGLWEAGVRSTKHHLRRVIGETTLTFEEMTTVLAQIEACLNSRPLTSLSSDPDDFSALTPGHLLIGEPLLAIPEPTTLGIAENRLSRWQLTTNMRDHFWRRWSSEYLHQLQQRVKWSASGEQIQIGRLVLLKDERLPPTKWLLGRVTATHPGNDGVIRVVTVKTATSTFKRPVVKLCPLPKEIVSPAPAT